jgi:peptidoglycan/LPS O-acetylase OafA/YrhL
MLICWIDWKKFSQPSVKTADIIFITGLVLTILWLGQVVFTFAAVYWRGHWSMVIAPIALGSALTLMVLGIYWGSRIGKFLFANPLVYFIGLISYSFYLWHFVVMQQVLKLGGESYTALPGFAKFCICTLLVTAVSSASLAPTNNSASHS